MRGSKEWKKTFGMFREKGATTKKKRVYDKKERERELV